MRALGPVAWFCFGLLPLAARADPPPASAYAALPVAENARLSPDGKSFAYIDGSGENLALVVASVDSNAVLPIPTDAWTPDWVRWKDNQTLLTSLRQTTLLDNGVPIPGTRLVAIAADGSRAKAVIFDRSFDAEDAVYGDTGNLVPNLQDDLISALPDQPAHILMEVPYQTYVYPSVFDVDLWNGDKNMRTGQFRNVIHWAADQNGVVRAGRTFNEQGGGAYRSQVIARASAGDGWHTIDVEAASVGFSPTDPNTLYLLTSPQNGAASIDQFDIDSGALVSTLCTGAEGTIAMLTSNGLMVGYVAAHAEGGVATYTDPAWAADAATIAGALKLRGVLIVDRSTDGERVTALLSRRGAPPALWLLDRTQNPANLSPLISDYPDVPANQIAIGRWSRFSARDGLVIPVLLTLPVNAAPDDVGPPIPFVVLPHGGPSARDSGGFDYLVQFLASRGYGVLQPQFRGSTGFGADFQAKGKQQWGLAMQDDVTDATKWLIDQHLADPKEICIVGASYGGYAALEGAEKEPSLYACAAAIAPVTDLPAFIRDRRNFAFADQNIPQIGDDSSKLEATSPDLHADQIQIPILLIHGRKDFTVSVQQTEKMEAALIAAGKTEQTIYLADADHYLGRPGDRLAVLNALGGFLARNLGAAP